MNSNGTPPSQSWPWLTGEMVRSTSSAPVVVESSGFVGAFRITGPLAESTIEGAGLLAWTSAMNPEGFLHDAKSRLGVESLYFPLLYNDDRVASLMLGCLVTPDHVSSPDATQALD